MLWHNEKTEGCGVTMAPFTSPRGLALRRKWRQETNLYCLFLLHSAITSTLATPSALTRHCLATARSRRGSDMPPACHSLPRRRFATLKGAALRGKDSALAPLLGALSRKRLRGRQTRTIADWEKTEQGEEHMIPAFTSHCLTIN